MPQENLQTRCRALRGGRGRTPWPSPSSVDFQAFQLPAGLSEGGPRMCSGDEERAPSQTCRFMRGAVRNCWTATRCRLTVAGLVSAVHQLQSTTAPLPRLPPLPCSCSAGVGGIGVLWCRAQSHQNKNPPALPDQLRPVFNAGRSPLPRGHLLWADLGTGGFATTPNNCAEAQICLSPPEPAGGGRAWACPRHPSCTCDAEC